VTIVDLDVAPRSIGRPRRMVPSRSVALFVLGLLTLVLVTASARPAPHFAGVLWSAPYDRDDDTMTLTPTSLYLFQHDAGGPRLKAYDMATGALRWAVPAPDVIAQVPSVSGGVVVVPDGFQRYFNRPDLLLARTTRTVARDARTGAVRWRAAGAPQDVTDRSVLLLDADADISGVAQLHNVSLLDGHTLWSRPAPGLSSVAVVGDAVVTAAADGLLTTLRYGDGAVVRTKKVAWPDNGRLWAAAGDLVVTSQSPAGQTSTVYRPDTLAELWRAEGTLTDCRAVVCGVDPRGLIGYEPATGAPRWQAAAMTVASPIGDDRVMASSELNGRFQLIEPATGRPVGAPGTGVGSWRTDGPSVVGDAPAAASAFVLRAVTGAPDETAVVRLDVRTGDQHALGTVDGTGWSGCRTVTKYLVCLQNTRITVTAVD
jgi:PQQ-like domain